MESTVNNVLETVQDVEDSHAAHSYEQSSSEAITIHSSPSNSILLDIEIPLAPAKSNNEERVLDALKPKSTVAASRLQREICIEDVCFHPSREKLEETDHLGHRTITYSVLLRELQVLKCNHRLTEGDSQQTMQLLDSIDRIYEEILCFQDEIGRLFQQVKLEAQRHISTVKQSFLLDHYHRMRKQLQQCFDYANVKYALAEVEKFKLIQYPSLDYPKFKLGNMEKRIGLANVNNKLIGVEAINSWVQRLQALDKKDRKIIYNRSIATFLNKSTCEESIFSHYLRANEYSSTNSKVLRRLQAINENVPVAVVEKEMLPGTEIKFKVSNLGKGMFIGVSTLRAIHQNNFENLVMEEGSYYLSSKGDILPFDQERRKQIPRMSYQTGDEISLRRQRNTIYWRRRGQGKYEQQVRVTLSIAEYSHNFYPCVHLEDAEGVLQLID